MNGATAGTWDRRRAATAWSTPSTPSTPSTCCGSPRPTRPTARPSPRAQRHPGHLQQAGQSSRPSPPRDLTFTSAPAGVTVNVGTPIAVDNATDPTIIEFPISFTKAVGVLANGSYTFTVQSPPAGRSSCPRTARTSSPPAPSHSRSPTSPRRRHQHQVSGRTVTIQFSKALDPATVTLGNIFVHPQGRIATTWPPTPATSRSYIDLNNDPRTTISYNPLDASR